MIYLSGPLACKLAFLPFFNEYGSFDLFMSDLREHSLAIPRVIWLFSPNGDMMVKCSSKKKTHFGECRVGGIAESSNLLQEHQL